MNKRVVRSKDHQYAIRHSPAYFHAGTVATGEQVLLGLHLPALIAIFFDHGGKMLRAEHRRYSFEFDRRPDGTFVVNEGVSKAMRNDLRKWKVELGFRPGTICIRRFRLPDLYIGVRDLPSHYEEFLNSASECDPKRRSELEHDIEQWIEEGQFVLQWNEDYDMDKKGAVVST